MRREKPLDFGGGQNVKWPYFDNNPIRVWSPRFLLLASSIQASEPIRQT
jgi:hypothetical protein